jgi:hypothetical protein
MTGDLQISASLPDEQSTEAAKYSAICRFLQLN